MTDALDIGVHEFSLATTDTLALGGTSNVNLQVNFRINGLCLLLNLVGVMLKIVSTEILLMF